MGLWDGELGEFDIDGLLRTRYMGGLVYARSIGEIELNVGLCNINAGL